MYIGQLVAAMYTDNLWYRARIVGCHEDLFQVFYVDYGSKNFVKLDRIRHLHLHFLKMPLQVTFYFKIVRLFCIKISLLYSRLSEVESLAFSRYNTRLNGHLNQGNVCWISLKVISFNCVFI